VGLACVPRAVRQGNADVLHHPLVFMVQDVAVQHEVADVALITGATSVYWPGGLPGGTRFSPIAYLPYALQRAVLRVGCVNRIHGIRGADVFSVGIRNLGDLER
jgi:hypothetical protein